MKIIWGVIREKAEQLRGSCGGSGIIKTTRVKSLRRVFYDSIFIHFNLNVKVFSFSVLPKFERPLDTHLQTDDEAVDEEHFQI